MPKRSDNLHKRKDGRWEGRYKKGQKADGTIFYGSVYGKTYSEAKKKLEAIQQAPSLKTTRQKQERIFGDILSLWMENNRIRLKGGTINKYHNLINTHIAPALGHVKLSEINPTMINTFLMKKMESGKLDGTGKLSPSYVRSIMLVITAALRFAVAEQMCLPFRTPIYKPPLAEKELPVLSIDAQRKLENYLLCEINPTKAGILISLHTGIRLGEICALSWDEVDLQNRIIRIRHTIARVKNNDIAVSHATRLIIDRPKTRSSNRDIPISSVLLPVLTTIYSQSTSKYVISDTDSFVSPRTLENRYHRLLKQCGIASVNFHALRHTFATRCIEAGVDVKSLCEILGHANVSTTLSTYVHSSMELKRSQLEKLTTFSN